MKKRIWELDALRGLALLGMIAIHLIYDLVDLYGVIQWEQPTGYLLFKNNYGLLFLVISGISVTLGTRCVKRGFQVFCCGFLCTAATAGMVLAGQAGKDLIIYYGVLHCLGTCMMLWPLFRKIPGWGRGVLGILMIAAGLWLRSQWFDCPWYVIPFGFTPYWFASSDYFPLLPNLGYFLLGSILGQTIYKSKTSLFPRANTENPVVKFLSWCGVHSLLIYLLHQPILAVVVGML